MFFAIICRSCGKRPPNFWSARPVQEIPTFRTKIGLIHLLLSHRTEGGSRRCWRYFVFLISLRYQGELGYRVGDKQIITNFSSVYIGSQEKVYTTFFKIRCRWADVCLLMRSYCRESNTCHPLILNFKLWGVITVIYIYIFTVLFVFFRLLHGRRYYLGEARILYTPRWVYIIFSLSWTFILSNSSIGVRRDV